VINTSGAEVSLHLRRVGQAVELHREPGVPLGTDKPSDKRYFTTTVGALLSGRVIISKLGRIVSEDTVLGQTSGQYADMVCVLSQ
jgi:hypothetical protein